VSGRWFDLAFATAGGVLLLFVLLPLANILVTLTPRQLWQSMIDPQVTKAITRTFAASGVATVVALFGGVPLAYLLARRQFWGRRLVEGVINLPVVVPHTAAGIALLMVFGRRGTLGRWLAPVGIFFTDSLGGIILGMFFVSVPFLVSTSREAFALIDDELERVALIDGATPWQAFWLITLPLAWRGVLSGAVMMWARGMSEFGAIVILAYHPKIAPVLIFERFQGFGLAAAQPVAAILIVVTLATFILVRGILHPEL
jgi:molybdate/tungstate transport system permease protein